MRNQSSNQWLMCVVAVLLTLNLLVQVTALSSSPAMAQNRSGAGPENSPPTPFPNSAESFRRLNETMIEVKDRLSRIEAKLEKGLTVKVTEMPAVEVKNPKGD